VPEAEAGHRSAAPHLDLDASEPNILPWAMLRTRRCGSSTARLRLVRASRLTTSRSNTPVELRAALEVGDVQGHVLGPHGKHLRLVGSRSPPHTAAILQEDRSVDLPGRYSVSVTRRFAADLLSDRTALSSPILDTSGPELDRAIARCRWRPDGPDGSPRRKHDVHDEAHDQKPRDRCSARAGQRLRDPHGIRGQRPGLRRGGQRDGGGGTRGDGRRGPQRPPPGQLPVGSRVHPYGSAAAVLSRVGPRREVGGWLGPPASSA
jgi:hypothetical protein